MRFGVALKHTHRYKCKDCGNFWTTFCKKQDCKLPPVIMTYCYLCSELKQVTLDEFIR